MTLTRDKIPQKKTLQKFVRQRLRNLGVPHKTARDISDRFAFQLTHQGEVGAIRYIKACGEKLLAYLHGETALKTDASQQWVATHSRFPVFFEGLQDQTEELLTRVSKLARAIRFGTVHQDQVDKVTQAVVTPYSGTTFGLSQLSSLVELGAKSLDLKDLCSDMTPYYLRYPRLQDKFQRVVSTSCKMSKAFDLNNQEPISKDVMLKEPPFKESLQLVADHPQLQVGPWEDVFYPMKPWYVAEYVQDRIRPIEERNHFVGEIHATVEGAMKLRMFASPYTVISLLLYPLHYAIADLKDRWLDTDCTRDQESGAIWAQDHLNRSCAVYSVDLSTATCRFPLEPQVKLLRFLGIPEDEISRFEYVCRGHWYCGVDTATAFATSSLQWEVGQPLGIPPSMSVFSLTHNLLLRGLCIKHRRPPVDTFRILGDDVVISDQCVAEAYISVLEEAGIPVSWTKTHCSMNYAEFAGYSVSRASRVRPGQWRLATHVNMLSISEDLRSPLTGETTLFHQEIQKLHLFRKGLYNPPVEDVPMMIRLSTEFGYCQLERWALYNHPIKHYKVQEVIQGQLKLPRSLESEVLYQECISVSSHLYDFLARLAVSLEEKAGVQARGDSLLDIVNLMWYDNHCHQHTHEPVHSSRLGFVEVFSELNDMSTSATHHHAYQVLNTLWWTGLMSEYDYHKAVTDMNEVVRSLLYMPPSASAENKLISLGKRIGKFLKAKESLLNETQYSPVRSGYYRFS